MRSPLARFAHAASALFLLTAACGEGRDAPLIDEGSELRVTDASIVGDYKAAEVLDGDFGHLVLARSNGGEQRFSGTLLAALAGRRVMCVRAPCRVPVRGTWDLSTSGKWLYLDLDGSETTRKYGVKIVGDRLELSRAGAGVQKLERAPSSCGAGCGAGQVCDDATDRCTAEPPDDDSPGPCASVRCSGGLRCRVLHMPNGEPYGACSPRP